MPSRPSKSKQKPTAAADVDIDSFFASQQSTGSDDGMMALIAQQMQASLEKKNKARDAKFVQATKNELQKVIRARAVEVQQLKTDLSDQVETFMTEYAANEDAIRALWVEISKYRDGLMDVVSKGQDLANEADRERSTKSMEPLTRYKAATEELNRIAASLVALPSN